MYLFEPSRAWQDNQHQSILNNDVTAFAELCEVALPYLVSFLQENFPLNAASLHLTVGIDCLLDYQARAERYDPGRLSLFAYLRMAARRDMLNAIDKEQRHEQRLVDIDEPSLEFQLQDQTSEEQKELDDWLQEHTDLSLSELLKALDAELDPYEKSVLLLMLDGVHESSQYAEALKMTHLDKESQQKIVKQAKDRVVKKLRRFGQRINKT